MHQGAQPIARGFYSARRSGAVQARVHTHHKCSHELWTRQRLLSIPECASSGAVNLNEQRVQHALLAEFGLVVHKLTLLKEGGPGVEGEVVRLPL